MSDIVRIGDATLYHGDCLEILPTLGKFDAVITDPPYGIGYSAQPTRWQRKNGKVAESWDLSAPHEILAQCLAKADAAIVWGGNYFRLPPSRGWLAWNKPDGPDSFADFELAWTSRDMNSRIFHKSAKSASLERGLAATAHPNQKPIDLMLWCLSFVGDAQSIFDPFMGSGTTGVACAQLGRKFTGIEIERKYFDIACERIERAYAQGQLIPHEPAPKPEQEGLAL